MAMQYIRRIIFYVVVVVALFSCGNRETRGSDDNADSGFTSIWDGFDFSQKAMSSAPLETESKFKNFCNELASLKEKDRNQQIDTLLTRSARTGIEPLLEFMDLA